VSIETAEGWAQALLQLDVRKVDGAPFALAQLCRLTGDRTRDIDESLRASAVSALKSANAPEPWLRMMSEVTQLSAADEARALGDTLPAGLALS
jgi:hypothetical protein